MNEIDILIPKDNIDNTNVRHSKTTKT